MASRLVLGAAACLVLALCSVVAAVGQGQDGERPGADVAPVASVQAAAAEALTLLSRERTPSDAMPPDVAEHYGSDARFGMNPGLSRRAVAETMHSVYLIPADGHVCLSLTLGQGATTTCAPTSVIAAGSAPPATASVGGTAFAVYGVVPDGVDEVTIDTASAPLAVPVSNNVYYSVVTSGEAPRTVTYDAPAGAREWPVHDPTAPAGPG